MGRRLKLLVAFLKRPLTLRNPIAVPPLAMDAQGEFKHPSLAHLDGFVYNEGDAPKKFSEAGSGFQIYIPKGHKKNITPGDKASELMFRGTVRIGDKEWKKANALIIFSQEEVKKD